MGGVCSKKSSHRGSSSGSANLYAAGRGGYQSNGAKEAKPNVQIEVKKIDQSGFTPSQARLSVDKKPQEELQQVKESGLFGEAGNTGYESNEDDFYDGIPRLPKALSLKSRSRRVSAVGSRLGKAGSVGIGKAVNVLDTLGSSMSSLNNHSGFKASGTTKSNELQILAFEVANTIVKGSTLVQSLSKESVRQLKEVVFASEGVKRLVSEDPKELLTVVAGDKRKELEIFGGEVVRFGNRSKDSQWHNLDRYFEKRSKETAPNKQLQEEAELMMEELMILVQFTAELYQEMQALDKLEEDIQHKSQDAYTSFAAQKGNNLATLRAELKTQKRTIKNLKKRSLWSRSLEEVMEKLVDIILLLCWEMRNIFTHADGTDPFQGFADNQKRLGPLGLSLHYANMVLQIDTIVARCNNMPTSLRDTLYNSLPPSIKSSLWSKLQAFHVKEELTVTQIRDEMEKTLHWLVPMAINTSKDHHGFGWVGEWASKGSGGSRKPAGVMDVSRIETFHYADKDKMEACIVELVLWLNHLIRKAKVAAAAQPALNGAAQSFTANSSPQTTTPNRESSVKSPMESAGSSKEVEVHQEQKEEANAKQQAQV